MKRNIVVQSLLVICILLTLYSLSVAEEDRMDGNWWRNQDKFTRAVYLTGIVNGIDLGFTLSIVKLIEDEKTYGCGIKIEETHVDYSSKYFKNVTRGQLVDGVNSFFQSSGRLTAATDFWPSCHCLAQF